MKNFIIYSVILSCLNIFNCEAAEIPYKNLKVGTKIKYSETNYKWSFASKSDNYYTKYKSPYNFSEFYSKSGEKAFITGCQYDFLYNGHLIGYSNSTLKFYEFIFDSESFIPRELTKDEIQSMFPNYKIINISSFSLNTNSIKLKKNKSKEKIILFNDLDNDFSNYTFTSGNAKFDTYPLKGFIDINQKGMIQFSQYYENTPETPWFILLFR